LIDQVGYYFLDDYVSIWYFLPFIKNYMVVLWLYPKTISVK